MDHATRTPTIEPSLPPELSFHATTTVFPWRAAEGSQRRAPPSALSLTNTSGPKETIGFPSGPALALWRETAKTKNGTSATDANRIVVCIGLVTPKSHRRAQE